MGWGRNDGLLTIRSPARPAAAARLLPLACAVAALELLAAGGECVYYFVEQLQW